MIPPEVIVVPVVFGIPAAVFLTLRWFRHQERMSGVTEGREHAAMIEQRLARIEHAVDAIAVEMERMGEGQRFVTKLLAERVAPATEARLPDSRHLE